jgi:transcription-repair coupling factor (superfamily II helicase)
MQNGAFLPGSLFSPHGHWHEEFEEAFEFAETPDQLTAIQDVYRDMESELPMDRLLCGDVGFGRPKLPCGPHSRRPLTASRSH